MPPDSPEAQPRPAKGHRRPHTPETIQTTRNDPELAIGGLLVDGCNGDDMALEGSASCLAELAEGCGLADLARRLRRIYRAMGSHGTASDGRQDAEALADELTRPLQEEAVRWPCQATG